MALISIDDLIAQQQSNGGGSVDPSQMAQAASQMPNGVQTPQIPVTPGPGYGMNTMNAINANSMLGPDANKAAINANIANQAKANAIPIDVAQKQALIAPEVQQTIQQEQAKNIVAAQTSVARDSANTNMIAGIGRQLMDYYDEADKNGLTGDNYRNLLGQAIASGKIPKELQPFLPNAGPVGAYNAISNEWKTRMTPVMQEQFGKEGGSRIMDSMLQMAEKEVPGLNQPREVAQRQLGATIKNFVRFTFGTADYKSRLGKDGNIGADTPQGTVDAVAKKLWNMSSVALKPEVERQISDISAYVTKDSKYQFAKNPDTGEIAIKGNGENKWRVLGQ